MRNKLSTLEVRRIMLRYLPQAEIESYNYDRDLFMASIQILNVWVAELKTPVVSNYAERLIKFVAYGVSQTPNSNGYHNERHARQTTINMVNMIEDMRKKKAELGIPESDVEIMHYISMVVAAAFHDANHSGGALADTHNITLAISAVDSITTPNSLRPLLPTISSMIASTQFSGDVDEYKARQPQYMLRDADLMGFRFDSYADQLIGLAAEIGYEFRTRADVMMFLGRQCWFFTDMNFETEYARNRAAAFFAVLTQNLNMVGQKAALRLDTDDERVHIVLMLPTQSYPTDSTVFKETVRITLGLMQALREVYLIIYYRELGAALDRGESLIMVDRPDPASDTRYATQDFFRYPYALFDLAQHVKSELVRIRGAYSDDAVINSVLDKHINSLKH